MHALVRGEPLSSKLRNFASRTKRHRSVLWNKALYRYLEPLIRLDTILTDLLSTNEDAVPFLEFSIRPDLT